MEKIPKNNIFNTPDGYFESLPDRILERKSKDAKTVYLHAVKYVAAAAFVIGLIYFFTPSQSYEENFFQSTVMEDEIELYIASDYWQAEDILAFVENPNDLLDEILSEEWSSFEFYEEDNNDDLWY